MPVFSPFKSQKPAYAVARFDGGANYAYSPQQIADSESPDLLNVDFDEIGSVGTRRGSTLLNTTSVGTYACDGLFTTKWSSGNQTMVAAFGGHLYTLGTTTFTTIPSAQSIYSAGDAFTAMQQIYNVAVFGNGQISPYKYNGAEWTRLGIPAPTGTMVAASSSAGALTGAYTYALAYVNSYSVEGNPGVTATVTYASAVGGLSGIPVAPTSYGIENKYIYRTKAGGSTLYYLTSVTAAVTSYADSTADTSLTVEAETDHYQPPNFSLAVVHRDRLFVNDPSNPQLIWYSDALNPFGYGALSYINVNKGDKEKVVDLQVLGNSIAIFKENSIWYLYIDSDNTTEWQLMRTNAAVGGLGPHCAQPFQPETGESGLVFLGQAEGKPSGFHLLNMGRLQELAVQGMVSNSLSERIDNYLRPYITYSQRAKIRSLYYRNRLYFAVPYDASGGSATYNNRIFIYDYNRRSVEGKIGAFVPWSGMNAGAFTTYNGVPYYGDATATGYVYRFEVDSTYTDNGSAINSYYRTRMYRGPRDLERSYKTWRRAYLWCNLLGAWPMSVYWRSLGETTDGNQASIDLTSSGSVWGTMVWGTGSWGAAKNDNLFTIYLGGVKSQGIQFMFSNENTASRAFRVKTLEFDFIPLAPR